MLPGLVPSGMRVLVSGSGQSLPVVPWISILNLDVTTTAQEGLYVVYLFRRDLSRVYLSMNQGATQHRRNAEDRGLVGVKAEAAALTELHRESVLLRNGLSDAAKEGLIEEIDLAAPAYFLPRGYEAGNVVAADYDLARLPNEGTLRADLTRFLALYASCVEIKDEVLASDPGRMQTTAGAKQTRTAPAPKPPIFRPKNSGDYVVKVKAQVQKKGRRHENLLKDFATWIKASGLVPANNVHPRDLTVDSEDVHWLVEAKTVGANAEQAVREAIGQLFSYRHFYYREAGRNDPPMVALFSEPIGAAFPSLLTSLGIECIWQAGPTWQGSAPAGGESLLKAAGGALSL